jgi:thioredoxin reductase
MRQFDVAVVGAGPAGISAAIASARQGATTILIDENKQPGGQLLWRVGMTLESTGGLDVDAGPGPVVASSLTEILGGLPALTVETSTVAWGLFEDNTLGISTETSAHEIQAKSIVLATGSTDRAHPFPGWTLPGVMTCRAAQIFLHVHRVIPGRRWAILGETPEADELVEDLERAGLEVAARCTSADEIRSSGTNRLAHVEFGDEVFEVDALAISLGRQPDAELAFHANVENSFVSELGGFCPRRNRFGRTSEPGIFIAGDAAGIASLPELVAEGRLAGLAAADAPESELEQALDALERIATPTRQKAILSLGLDAQAS